jgi:hypothetical protein
MRPFYSAQEAIVYAERVQAAGPFTVLVKSVMTHCCCIARWPDAGAWSFMFTGRTR